ncbi:MAG: hypothetical protein J3Q66DRAFT_139557 [Benniella sp.]|nr:MAG: hypothetical protein J3Q66DRAFT_139557 [Benniella sp.]
MGDSLYIIKDAPGKGRGMFATQDIKRGTCIIAESPLVYISDLNSLAENLAAVEALSKKNKKYFYALRNVHEGIRLPQEFGIIQTNSLPLGSDSPDRAVYRIISRINHSCAPNVTHTWNPKTNKENIYAIKDIPEGSEILTSYLLPFMTRAERQEVLSRSFRFTCQCEVCAVDSSEEYDAAVKRIKLCTDLIVSSASSNPRKSIGYVREALALMDKIDERGKTPYYYDGYQICAQYSDYIEAKKWADLLLESYVMEEGEEGEKYARYLKYSQNPRSHERAGCGGYISFRGT